MASRADRRRSEVPPASNRGPAAGAALATVMVLLVLAGTFWSFIQAFGEFYMAESQLGSTALFLMLDLIGFAPSLVVARLWLRWRATRTARAANVLLWIWVAGWTLVMLWAGTG